MQKLFIVSHDDREFGPFTREEISARLKSGEFLVVDFVYVEEQNDWVTLLEFLPETNTDSRGSEVSRATPPDVPKSAFQVRSGSTAAAKGKAVSVVNGAPSVAANAPAALSKTSARPSQIELHGGVGTIEVVQTVAGQMSLRVKSPTGGTLEIPQPFPLTVKAAPAEKLSLKGPTEAVAGQSFTFHLEAVDRYGNVDVAFTSSVTVNGSGSAQGGGLVKFTAGRAQVTFTDKVAERVTLKIADTEKTGLDVTASHASLVVNPAPAARLTVSAPSDAVAGQPLKITVKAVDAFGNLATGFGGTVKVEIDEPAA